MSLDEFKVTNITQGCLELRPYKVVLGPHQSVTLIAPIAEEVHWLLGRKFIKIEAAVKGASKTAPFSLVATKPIESKRSRKDRDS